MVEKDNGHLDVTQRNFPRLGFLLLMLRPHLFFCRWGKSSCLGALLQHHHTLDLGDLVDTETSLWAKLPKLRATDFLETLLGDTEANKGRCRLPSPLNPSISSRNGYYIAGKGQDHFHRQATDRCSSSNSQGKGLPAFDFTGSDPRRTVLPLGGQDLGPHEFFV